MKAERVSQVSGSPLSSQTQNTSRPFANFQPDIWGDQFLVEPATTAPEEVLVEELKETVKREFKATAKNALQQLQLIDSIQRLGIAYHFEVEIDEALQYLMDRYTDFLECNDDIYSTALSFRLLRQHGHRVSSKIFEKFKDDQSDEDEFKFSINGDVMGMLEFYEATHLSVHGEDVLDYGRDFTRTQLQSMLPNISNTSVAEQVVHALKKPNRRGLTRLEARRYMPIYEQNTCHDKILLRLAKLDFNRLQSLHKWELAQICRWWKSLDVGRNLPFARDRVVEAYFWILGIYFEPHYILARKILAKVLAITSIIDDMYDAYGTLEELKFFTQAIERWSAACLDELPEYMKLCYQALLDVYQEIEEEMIKEKRLYRINYAKEVIKILVRAYQAEAEWRQKGYVPTLEEYMRVALESCGYASLIIISFLGMGDIATEEAFQWVLGSPDPVKAASVVCRLQDDIVGYKFDKQRDHVASAIDCYMKDNINSSKEQAINKLKNEIEKAWKDINDGFLRPTKIPAPLIDRALNFARVIDVVYKEDDWYTRVGPEMQAYIKQILVDPVPE
ncbi:Bicyclogermacrene synthase [Handroanthus impetiginosus]|uniref:Bicyclogermacrene synthase n=1 Tax=Handroanthus impetiginosus TaxID=429701 RepID=A0A2G9I4W5_9LAMI|nr:Bicyclogermacrene synthase [Handroanthus impetiginosus]